MSVPFALSPEVNLTQIRHLEPLLDRLQEALAVIWADGTLLWCNRALAELAGVNRADLPQPGFFPSPMEAGLARGGTSFQCLRHPLVASDEKETWLLTFQPVTVPEPRHEPADLFRNLFEHAPIGMYRSTPDGRLLLANQALVHMFGYDSFDEIRTRNLNNPDDFQLEYDRAAFLRRLEQHGEIHGLSAVWRRRDGTLIHINENVRAVRGEDGTLLYLEGTVEDISERKITEAALRNRETFIRTVLDSLVSSVMVLDREGRILTYNRAWEELVKQHRLAPAFLTPGADYLAILRQTTTGNPTAEREFADRVEQVLEGASFGCTLEYKLNQEQPDNWFGMRVMPLQQEAGGVVITHTNTTDRKQAEELMRLAHNTAIEAARTKSQFLANMSHEIRTPLNGVIGMTHLLMGTSLDAEQSDFVETIQQCGDALLSIINDILDFSKLEAGKMKIEVIEFDFIGLFERLYRLFQERTRSKAIAFSYHIDPDLPGILVGDPARLRQILMNLVSNAIKFTERGSVTFAAYKKAETETAITVRFEVQDTGIGIPAEICHHLFQPFAQADDSTTRRFGGTGLGLAICKELTEMMGGTIGVESEVGVGSTFWLTLDFQKYNQSTDSFESELKLPPGVRLLVVDDNSTNRDILCRQVQGWKLFCESVGSGTQALETLRHAVEGGNPYHFVLLDMLMPEMDGMELARRIKSEAALADTLLVMLTSFSRRGHGEEALQAGISAYLSKPVSSRQLYRGLVKVWFERGGGETGLVTRYELGETGERPLPEKGFRVLLVEDSDINQAVAKGMLERLGCQVEVASNGLKALNLLQSTSFDLIFMDCQMPVMDGFETTGTIRERETGTDRHIPIVALTASAMPGDREQCLAAGMDDYISKPFKPEAFADMLHRWAQHRQPQPVAHAAAPVPSLELEPETEIQTLEPTPVIEETAFEQIEYLANGDDSFVVSILNSFYKGMIDSLQLAQNSLAANDRDQLRRAAHKMKGNAYSVGAARIAEITKVMEATALQETTAQITIWMEKLRGAITEYEQAVTARLGGNDTWLKM
ncbi:MAG: response regulator [Blastocatellia bacterium]|nr:response regulator [Blastocatellia bacterium]